jgi:hypothetical protein
MTTTATFSELTRTVEAQNVHTISSDGDAAVPGLGNVSAGFAFAGSSTTQGLRLTITGLSLGTSNPRVVLLQSRQSDNQEHNWSDEFDIQVITTAPDRIRCRILRTDNPNAGGWGQNLRIDFLIVS